MQLVTFTGELTKEQTRAAATLAKADKGGWSKENGGYLMRDEESAQRLADTVLNDEDAVADAQPLSVKDMSAATDATVLQEAEDSVHTYQYDEGREWLGEGKPEQTTEARKQPKPKTKVASANKLVTDDRYEQLKARMRKKLGQVNVGIDPEMLAIGTEMAVYHIEKGIRKFAPYAKAMIEDLGDAIRPYLKSFYNAVRDLPEAEENGWADELTSYDEVRKFDVANFDKEDADAMATADMVVKEQQAQAQAEEAKEQLTQTRNNTRHEEEEQRAADTLAKAESIDVKLMSESDLRKVANGEDKELADQAKKEHDARMKERNMQNNIKPLIDNGNVFSIQYTDGGRRSYHSTSYKDSTTTTITKDEYDWALAHGGKKVSDAEQKDIDDENEFNQLNKWFTKEFPHRDLDEVIDTIEKSDNQLSKEQNLPNLKRLKELWDSKKERRDRITSDGEAYNTEEPSKVGTQPDKKIEDVGEKIGGARKDATLNYAKKIDLNAKTPSKVFPKPNFQSMEKAGVPRETLVKLKAYYTAFSITNANKKARNAEQRILSARFYGQIARDMLLRDVDVKNESAEGIVLTDYGKEHLDYLTKCIEALAKSDREDFFDLDLSDVDLHISGFKENEQGYYETSDGRRWVSTSMSSRVVEGRRRGSTSMSSRVAEGSDKFVCLGRKLFAPDDIEGLAKEYCSQVEASHNKKVQDEIKFHVYRNRNNGECYVTAKVKGASEEIQIKDGFKTSKEAFTYIGENANELRAEARAKADEAKAGRTGGGKGLSNDDIERAIRDIVSEERIGKDHRNGKDVSADDFRNQFGFRGVEFGNWATQKERQQHLNACYDALMDLSELLGVSPKALSLGGKLGFAFGSRGHSKALAHYEPAKHVINLTKKRCAGCVAHEWFHALDTYFGGGTFSVDGNMATTGRGAKVGTEDGMRPEMFKLFMELRDALASSDMASRSRVLDGNKDKAYWASPEEMAARAFETYVNVRMMERGQRDQYLSAHVPGADAKIEALAKHDPYPTAEESKKFGEIFDRLFDTMEERTDEEGNQVLYRENVSNNVKNGRIIPDDVEKEVSLQIENTYDKAISNAVNGLSEADANEVKRESLKTVNGVRRLPFANGTTESGKTVLGLDEMRDVLANDISSINFDIDFYEKRSKSLHTEASGLERRRLDFLRKNRAEMQANLAAVEREIEYRKQVAYRLRDKYGVGEDNAADIDIAKRIFDDYNDNADMTETFNAVYNSVKNIGLSFGIHEFKEFSTAGDFNHESGKIQLSLRDILNTGCDKEDIAATILHEFIHPATSDPIRLYELGGEYREKLTPEQQKVAKEVIDFHAELMKRKEDFLDSKGNLMYGLSKPTELLNEAMANMEFRSRLKEKGFFGKIKEWIKSLFGFSDTQKADKLFDAILKSYDLNDEKNRAIYDFVSANNNAIYGDNQGRFIGEKGADEEKLRDRDVADEEGNQVLFQLNGEDTSNETEARQAVTDYITKTLDETAGIELVHNTQEEGQKVAGGDAELMGTTTKKRQKGVENAFSGKTLTNEQKVVVDAFSGKTNNETLSIVDKNGKTRNVTFRQGDDMRAGVRHSVFRHNNTNENGYTADEVVKIPDILRNGDRTQNGNKVKYEHKENGITYTVTTEIKSTGDEVFTNFYTDKKPTAGVNNTSNTASQHVSPQLVSDAKVSKHYETTKNRGDVLTTSNGTVYGWAEGNKIHLTQEGINPNTPIHEYTHLWAKAVQKKAPELWNNIKSLLKDNPLVEQIIGEKGYEGLSEDGLMSEVLSRISGKKNSEKLEKKAQELLDQGHSKEEVSGLLAKAKKAVTDFWKWVGKNLFDIKEFDSVDDVADRVLYDLLNKTELGLDTESQGGAEFQVVTDKQTKEWFDKQPKIVTFKTVAVNKDGEMRAPMANKVKSSVADRIVTAKNGKTRKTKETAGTGGYEFGKLLVAEENPSLIKRTKSETRTDENGKNFEHEYGEIEIVREDGKSLIVAYDPYDHSSDSMINDQFKSAWERDNLIVIRQEIAKTDLDEHYMADNAYLPTGKHDWKTGVLGRAMENEDARHVYLARFSRPLKPVDWNEVAQEWIDKCKKYNLDVPFNIVPKAIREKLANAGINIVAPENGMGKNCFDAYEEWKQERLRYRQTLEFEDGEILPITHTADGYSLLGLSGDYPTKDALLDAFREKYSNYLVTYTEGGKAVEVTPWHKLLSETRNRRSKKADEAQSAYLARKTRNAKAAVTEQAKKLGLSVEVLDTTDGLTGRRAKAKGWYDSKTGKIVIVLPNHTNSSDVMRTLLHEGVAHHGLRELFGKDFDTFLDNVFANVSKDIRRDIVELSKKHGWNFRVATEEYLASMAEDTNFDRAMQQSWWRKVKFLFLEMLRKAGLHLTSALTDNDLRYILWRSYDNLVDPGVHNIFKTANAELVQQRLGVGNYAERNAEDNEEEVPRKIAEDDGFRYRDGSPMDERDRAIVRDRYEREMMSGLYQFREAVQDSMLSLRKLMEYISDENIEDIEGYENAYLAENALSSKNHAEQNLYGKMLFQPLLDAVHALKKDGASRDETTRYMMAKHGLERNKVMAKRQAEKDADAKLGKDLREAERAYKQDPSDQLLADALDAAKKAMQDKIDDLYQQYREKDYGGITGLMDEDDLATAEAMAQQIVDEFERDHDTTDLWQIVNACTKATLDKIYKSGMLSKQGYGEISGMYKYYIPLRGFDATTSDEVYSYLTHESSGFSSPLKKAEGRRSIADDPLATIANMADSAIVQGNRNLMKQKFLKFVLNHPSDAVSVNRMWLRYDDVTDQWEAVTAQLDEKDTPDDVLRKTEQFEEQMRQLAEADPDHYKRGKDAANIPYIALGRNLDEHQVHIRMGGDDYIVTINGNPRAAQALNGLTNPDADNAGNIGWLLEGAGKINRHLSAFYTTRNPEFVLSNFLRDAMYANSTMWVRERPNYAIKFNKNFLKINPGKMYRMLQKHNAGTLDMDDETEKAFYQFMMNGGETGYTVVKDIEKQKKLIKKYMKGKAAKIPVSVAWQLLGEKLDDINRSVESCARFAAFLTSRQMGRSVERSVYDAKEVSVNFNKKGAGAKFRGKHGQTWLGNRGAEISSAGKAFEVFWNAAIQGTTNFARLHKRHMAKALGYDATLFMLGALMAGFGGGDDDEYWNLPEYVRRANLCFKLPFTDSFVSIPLGIEMQGIYGMGELAASVLSGKERMSGMEIASAIAGQMSKMLPIDMMEGEGGLSAFIPSQIKPWTEAYVFNSDWRGMPIYKDTPWNEEDPEWTKAGKTTNKWLVNFTEALNSVSGGDDVQKGWLDVNPSKIEHLLEGTFGGYTTTANKLMKMGETAFGDQPFDWRNMLFASRVMKDGGEEAEARRNNREYRKYYDEYKETKRKVDRYEDQDDEGIMGAAEKLDFMYNSPEYGRYEIVDEYADDIKDLSDDMKETTDKEVLKDMEAEMRYLKKEMVDRIREYEDSLRLVK